MNRLLTDGGRMASGVGGGRSPNALCGRTGLYSRRHRSIKIFSTRPSCVRAVRKA